MSEAAVGILAVVPEAAVGISAVVQKAAVGISSAVMPKARSGERAEGAVVEIPLWNTQIPGERANKSSMKVQEQSLPV